MDENCDVVPTATTLLSVEEAHVQNSLGPKLGTFTRFDESMEKVAGDVVVNVRVETGLPLMTVRY